MAEAKVKKSGNRITKFFREVKSELKKVVWPNKKQVTKNTLVVIAVVVLVGIFIRVLDVAFGYGLSQFIKG